MASALMDLLGRSVIIGSGALGTCLRRTGEGATGLPVESLNLRNPQAVLSLHKAYVDAGSQILVTNTFAANRPALEEAGLAAFLAEINREGVLLARNATAGRDVMVWASVGPLSLGLRLSDFSDDALRELFQEQCEALVGADAIVLETFVDPREAAAALDAARSTGLPVIFQIGNIGGGRDRLQRLAELADLAVAQGAMAVGANCQQTSDLIETAGFLLGRSSVPVTAAPNAGHATVDRGAVIYHFAPEDLRKVGIVLWEMGVSVVGGCCGTTPDHIRALAGAIAGKPVVPRQVPTITTISSVSTRPSRARAVNPVRELIRSEQFLVSVEIRADRRSSLDDILAGAATIAAEGADLFDVPDNPAATVGRDAMVVAARLQSALGRPAFPHKSVVQGNLLQLHSSLLGCWDLGLKAVLAVTGDPPSVGHLAGMAKLVTDIRSSVELLRLIRELRNGRMINGEEVGDPPDFCAGCAVGQPTPQQFSWLRKKAEAGAEFAFSQPVFDADVFLRLSEGVSGMGLRVFPGVMPLVSRRLAEALAAGRVPGVRVPENIVEKFQRYGAAADQRKLGLDLARDLASRLIAEGASGIYLIMPFGRGCYEETACLVRYIRNAASAR